MTALDAADLVVIASRTLGIGTEAALARMDIPAAQAALAEAQSPRQEPSAAFANGVAAAAAGVRLVHALLRHRPFPDQNKQVAVAAGLQLLSLNGWRADLNPAATAAVVVEALASGRLTPGDAAAWLSPRLSKTSRRYRVSSAPVAVPRLRPRLQRLLPAAPAPVGRAVASALLAVTVGGVAVLSAACSRAPGTSATAAARPSPASARPADLAYAACMRSHGIVAQTPKRVLSGRYPVKISRQMVRTDPWLRPAVYSDGNRADAASWDAAVRSGLDRFDPTLRKSCAFS